MGFLFVALSVLAKNCFSKIVQLPGSLLNRLRWRSCCSVRLGSGCLGASCHGASDDEDVFETITRGARMLPNCDLKPLSGMLSNQTDAINTRESREQKNLAQRPDVESKCSLSA